MPFNLFRFLAFHDYRIPRTNLLNKTGDVTPDGKYVTPYKVCVKVWQGEFITTDTCRFILFIPILKCVNRY